LHNKELRNLYAARIVIGEFKPRRKKWTQHVARIEGSEQEAVEKKSERKRGLLRSKHRWNT